MSPERLAIASDIAEALRLRIRKGQGLSVPYARKWEVGGCHAIHSLRTHPYDGLLVLGTGLADLGHPVIPATNELIVDVGSDEFWVAANRSARGDGPPDAYLVGTSRGGTTRYVVNAAEVVVELLRGMSVDSPALPTADTLQIGFPGLNDTATTYVGSWQWNVHGEALDDIFLRRGASATLTAIEAKEAWDARHVG